MKILAIGDFHGKFPGKLKRIAQSKEIDLILCTGDFADADKIRKLIFKNWTDKPWYEQIGIKKAKQIEKESFDSGLNVLNELNKLNKKVYVVFGNSDFYRERGSTSDDPLIPGFYEDKIRKLKNIILVDNKKLSTRDFDILGFGGYVDCTEYIKNPIDGDKEEQIMRLERYLYDQLKLKKLFLKKGKSKEIIFLAHYPPYGVMDKVSFIKNSPMYGKHVGWEPYNEVIRKHKPKLVLCGHMHEYQGKKKLGKSLVVNPGAAFEGKAAVIEWPGLRVKFLR